MAEIAVVGGGPSGAMCGAELARAGHCVAIVDEHLAWEKPCGGGLTHKAIQSYPFLLDNPLAWVWSIWFATGVAAAASLMAQSAPFYRWSGGLALACALLPGLWLLADAVAGARGHSSRAQVEVM